ncbi:hypothetical protein BJ944DRAFT_266654 [Cunninghamella echinulata]|nr:hypothetical protein BJ944DRAFT_266654 [Cunninghamella echinulata]
MISKLHSVFILLVVLLSLEQVFGHEYSNMTVTLGEDFKGMSFKCDAVEYQRCHRMEPISSSVYDISSAIFTHKDPFVKDVSVTFYTGHSCDGHWIRKSGSMSNGQSWVWSSFGEYTRNINSFKIANFKTSTGNSGSSQQPPDTNPLPYIANCGVIRYQ